MRHQPIDFGDLLVAVAQDLEEIRQCVGCGADSTWTGLFVQDNGEVSVSAWCEAEACVYDRVTLSAGQVLAMPIDHLPGLRRPPGGDVAADERARIVWWLRAGLSGPAAVNVSAEALDHMRELADAIEQHPERFAAAPTGRPA